VLIFLPGNALLLGSWYGLAASLLLVGGVAYRTAMEDRNCVAVWKVTQSTLPAFDTG
jgi:hypothetical protein